MPLVKEKICVIGLGYIGLPTACLFAQAGFQVLGVDINPEIVEGVNAGHSHLALEPDLSKILADVVKQGRLKASSQPQSADLFLICVPTPFKDDHEADLTYIEAAVASILPRLQKGNAVVLESTSPPGTTEKLIADKIRAKNFKIGQDVFVAYCPERVMPGRILQELRRNARVVGGVTPACAEQIVSFYRKIVDAEVMVTRAKVAEVVKLVENSYRDVSIAFANEVSMLCDRLGIPHREVIALANHHPRVKILSPGPGVGGHCIAVDPWFLVEAAPLQTRLIRAAREVNIAKTQFVIHAIHQMVNERFKATGTFQRIYLFGMTYKADVADFRESPAIEIYHGLAKELGHMAKVWVVDPHLRTAADWAQIPSAPLAEVPLEGENILRIRLVAHKEFANLSFAMDFSC